MLFEQWPVISGWLRNRSDRELARMCAYFLAPAAVLSLAMLGGPQGGSVFDLTGPMTISELRSEMSLSGTSAIKNGVALLLEPTTAESRILVGSQTGRIWTSLDLEALNANRDRLAYSIDAFSVRTPFIGVNRPVAVIIEGTLGKEVQVPGGASSIDDWRLAPRRAVSIMSSVLIACAFAFGIALTAGTPAVAPHEETRAEITA